MNLTKTYAIYDCIFYDNAISSNYNDNWILSVNSPSIVRDENGTTVSSPDTTWRNIGVSSDKTNYMKLSNPVCLEFDVVLQNDTCRLEIYYATDLRLLLTFKNYGIGHYRIEYTPTSQKIYVDDILKQSNSFNFTGKNPRITLVVWNNGELKFKNFKIYSI